MYSAAGCSKGRPYSQGMSSVTCIRLAPVNISSLGPCLVVRNRRLGPTTLLPPDDQRLHEILQSPVDMSAWINYVLFDTMGDLIVGESFRCFETETLYVSRTCTCLS